MMASQQVRKARRKLRILTKGKPFSNIASREKMFMIPIELAKNEKRTKLEANNIFGVLPSHKHCVLNHIKS